MESNKRYIDEEEIDFIDLIFSIIRRWKVIVLIMVPIVMFGIFFAIAKPIEYKADVIVMITNPEETSAINGEKLNVDDSLIATYTQLAKSRDIMRRIINKYDLTVSEEELIKKVEVIPIPGTIFLKISYYSEEKKLIIPIINEIANEFIYKINQTMRLRNVSILESATSVYQLPQNKGTIIIISIIVGILLGYGVAAVIELLYRKLRKSSDIEKIIEAQMLGMIPEIEIVEKGEESYES